MKPIPLIAYYLITVFLGLQFLIATTQDPSVPETGLPDEASYWIKVQISGPGLTASEIENRFAIPVENRLRNSARAIELQSISTPGHAGLWLEFSSDQKPENKLQMLASHLNEMSFGEGTIRPEIRTVPWGPVLVVAVEADDHHRTNEQVARRCVLVDQLHSRLQRIPHVAFVSCWSEINLVIRIDPKREILAEHDLANQDIIDAVMKNIGQASDRYLRDEHESFRELLTDIPLITRNGDFLRLEDLAKIGLELKPSTGSGTNSSRIVLGIHIDEIGNVDSCSRELDRLLDDATELQTLKSTRNLKDMQLPWNTIQQESTNRMYPPDFMTSAKFNAKWQSHLLVQKPEALIRLRGEKTEILHVVAKEIHSLLSVTQIQLVGAATTPSIDFDTAIPEKLANGFDAEPLRQMIRDQIPGARTPGPRVLSSLAEVNIKNTPPDSSGITKIEEIAERIRLLESTTLPVTGVPLGSLVKFRTVHQHSEIWRVQNERTVGLLISADESLDVQQIESALQSVREKYLKLNPDLRIDFSHPAKK